MGHGAKPRDSFPRSTGSIPAACLQDRGELGRADVIYNNAGLIGSSDHSALDTSFETWNRVLTGNLTTTTMLSCKHGIPYMLGGDPARGPVINTASFLAGMGAASAQMAFNAGKAAVEQLSRDLGVQLARRACA